MTLSEEDRNKYITKYAAQIGVNPDAYSVAAYLISQNKNFQSACCFIFGLSARDPEQLAYVRKAADYLQNYLGDSYTEVTAEWLSEFVGGYVTEVDPSYRW